VTVKFYRQQASRLMQIAHDMHDPQTKAELLDIAAQFVRLAKHAEGAVSFAADD
jgi:hypothetical protein